MSSKSKKIKDLPIVIWFCGRCRCLKAAYKAGLFQDSGFWICASMWAYMCWLYAFNEHHIVRIIDRNLEPWPWVMRSMFFISEELYFGAGLFLGLLLTTLAGGHFVRKMEAVQRKIELVKIGGDSKNPPKVLEFKEKAFETRILLNSEGIGLPHYKSKSEDLGKSFGMFVDKIKDGKDHRNVEIVFTRRRVPERFLYSEALEESPLQPLDFFVGSSKKGLIKENLRELPHLMVAGTTKSGKSTFLNNILLGFLESSKKLKLVLVDLKNGVALGPFKDLPNVSFAKSRAQALTVLTELVKEMNERYDMLEKKGFKEIDPERDNLDVIVCCIDEASVLFSVRGVVDKNQRTEQLQARRLCDELAKKSRAAGIHLIVATQKVSIDTIDTHMQENLPAKICFKMSTIPGSVTVLGHSKANKIAKESGRAVWQWGLEEHVVQTPLIEDIELEERLELVHTKLEKELKQRESQKGDPEPEEQQRASDVSVLARKKSVESS